MQSITQIVIVGFGNVGQGLLPLLRGCFTCPIIIFDKADSDGRKSIASDYNADFIKKAITAENYISVLSPVLIEKAFLLNLAVSVSTLDLIAVAQGKKTFYLDSCIEPWEYKKSHGKIDTSNYALREQVLARRSKQKHLALPTAIVAHGANPGFVSVLVKKALLDMAGEKGMITSPKCQQEWGALARELDVKVIQISERDTQVSYIPRQKGEFNCTWSVNGFITEALQSSELGWGSHEPIMPDGAMAPSYGSKCGIELSETGREVRVKSWSPNALDFEGFLLTHNESLSIADYLTVKDHSGLLYRPTCYYAYHPCDAGVSSLQLLENGDENLVQSKRVIKEDVVAGLDELGVFIISGIHGGYWLGSNLSIGRTRKIAEHNNATSLQVVSSILAAMKWAAENPNRGIVESDELDWEFLYEHTKYFWEPIVSKFVNWLPCSEGTDHRFSDYLVNTPVEQSGAMELTRGI
ncbi:saccharopine dehydrogenase NADP-binding domain-containing protein [Pseudomonas amygdali]|uniref:saccharopine dehydrogenase NADP-binding domain-containing protein n=1 Tax=Pseudomonas amygdali TaxID=47877 RepID=UPI0035324A63